MKPKDLLHVKNIFFDAVEPGGKQGNQYDAKESVRENVRPPRQSGTKVPSSFISIHVQRTSSSAGYVSRESSLTTNRNNAASPKNWNARYDHPLAQTRNSSLRALD